MALVPTEVSGDLTRKNELIDKLGKALRIVRLRLYPNNEKTVLDELISEAEQEAEL